MSFLKICNRIIKYSFYAIFLLVPFAFTSATSELFELNKMWLTWGLTIVIATSWAIKMIFQKKFFLQRTPLDIPIVLFLLSQIISTIFSLDSHVSFWGYYSRFNGGLLSMASYIFLFYAFLSNFQMSGGRRGRDPNSAHLSEDEGALVGGKLLTGPDIVQMTKRLLSLSLISGLIVALWGLPSHFGYDPTCLLFRGTLDISCWTAEFIPTIRIFSTLGQPDWLAAYLAILIPIAIAFIMKNSKSEAPNPKQIQITKIQNSKNFEHSIFENLNLFRVSIFVLLILFYVDLLFTRARSGIIAAWISLIFFAGAYFFTAKSEKRKAKSKSFLLIPCLLLLITFVIGTPINQIRMLTLEGIGSVFQKTQVQKTAPAVPIVPHEPGGTESGHIRLLVWEGALNAWKANPLIGTGVETFAFAYYKYKPAGHNLTSEWNHLYNKAHNEYLNYLATTGIVGLGTYLAMIGYFLFLSLKQFKANYTLDAKRYTLILALIAGYLSILITNFFGFSVVITNIYLFMIPAFVFVLTGTIKPAISEKREEISRLSPASLTGIFFILVACLFLLIALFRFWRADIAYALGYNLDRAGEYQNAYQHLHKAVEIRGDEPIFKDELSINSAMLAAGLLAQQPAKEQEEQTITVASNLAQEAIDTSNEIISGYKNNAVFWKTRVRVFYTLSQVDSRYLPRALDAIEKASLLAPADANIWYNLGVLYGQNNNIPKGIEALERTISLRPNYRDAHYALGLYYRTASLDETGKVVTNEELNNKAIAQMRYILDNISPNDTGAMDFLKSWKQ